MKSLLVFLIFYIFLRFLLQAQSVVWQDSLSKAMVHFHIDENEYKAHPHRTSKAYEVIELDNIYYPVIISILKKAYRKYPTQLLKENVDNVYIYKQFDEGRATMGKYIGKHGFFYAVPFLENGNVDSLDFERLIHHELSHRIHIFNYKHFDFKSWKNCNLLKYRTIKSFNRNFNPDLYKKGFLYKYAILNKWEDFASFAENIFIYQPEFWDALANHSLLRKKFEIICSFYEALDSNLNEAYFLGLHGVDESQFR